MSEQDMRRRWLAISARKGDVARLKELVALGVEVDQFDDGATPLMYAAGRGHIAYVEELLAQGVDLLRADVNAKTAIDFAAEAGHTETVLRLIDRGASHAETEALLATIRAGLSLDDRDEYGATRLMRASAEGKSHLVEILLAHGADPRVATRFGHTATMLAVYHGHTSIATRLFEAGGMLPESPSFLPSKEAIEDAGLDEIITKYNAIPFETLWQSRVRVEITELSNDDFESYPIWECCGDEDDDVSVKRPVPFVEPFDHPTMGLVRVEFILPDGETYPGHANWDGFIGESFAQSAQPYLWAGTDWVHFYNTSVPPPRVDLDRFYKLLGRAPDLLFPIRVRSSVELAGQPREGILDGFAWYDCRKDGTRAVVTVR